MIRTPVLWLRRAFGDLYRLSLVPVLTLATHAADVSPSRYLFLDPALIAASQGSQVRVNPAERREIVIKPDRPWEQLMISFYVTVREEEGRLRMWYICRDRESHPNLAYAESRNGIDWTKPDLGIVEYAGSKANNLVGIASLEGTPFRDPNAPPAERYAYVTNLGGAGGIVRFYSADGLHWQRDPQPLLKFDSDTQNVTFWDERLKSYVLYLRGWDPKYRTVTRMALPSLTTPSTLVASGKGRFASGPNALQYFFDEIPTVLACDAHDPPRTDIYTMAAQPYVIDPSWYVAFPAFLRRSVASDAPDYHGSSHGPAEVQFAGSRDGIAWQRYDRAAYTRPGLASPAKKNMVYMGTGLVVRGDEIWQYGTEFESEHGDAGARERKTDGVIVRYVQRLDGFVSLNTGDEPGVARTVPVKVTGNRLILNLDTGALGEMRVALLDANGRPVPGFQAEKCQPLQGNSTGLAVAWMGGSDLSALVGTSIALEFHSSRTKLYSFRFE